LWKSGCGRIGGANGHPACWRIEDDKATRDKQHNGSPLGGGDPGLKAKGTYLALQAAKRPDKRERAPGTFARSDGADAPEHH